MKNYKYNTVRPEMLEYRDSIFDTSELGKIGTTEYATNVKRYFNLGDVNIDLLSKMEDQTKAYDIFSDYANREQKIISGEYLDERLQTLEHNFDEFITKYLDASDRDVEYIRNTIKNAGGKRLRLLSDIGKIMRDYYTLMKSIGNLHDEDAMVDAQEDALGRIFDTFDDWGF